jgi:hypothetical protein
MPALSGALPLTPPPRPPISPSHHLTISPSHHLTIDLKALHPDCDHVYGLAFHPQFTTNRQIHITDTVGHKKPGGSRLARFRVIQETPLLIDPTSEEILLTWLRGGHSSAVIAFDLDGYFYLSTGDAEVPNPADPLNTEQDLSDRLSSILSLDVDRAAEGKPYAVPAGTPLLNTPRCPPRNLGLQLPQPQGNQLRQKTGQLWCGDGRWQEWENLYLGLSSNEKPTNSPSRLPSAKHCPSKPTHPDRTNGAPSP